MTYLVVHSGIKGQKWGRRRYRNPDGTLTPEGRRRYKQYNKSEDQKAYEQNIRAPYQELSTKDITAINARDKQVSEYKKSHSTGREKFKTFMKANEATAVAAAVGGITAAVTQVVKDIGAGAKKRARGPYRKGKAWVGMMADKAVSKGKTRVKRMFEKMGKTRAGAKFKNMAKRAATRFTTRPAKRPVAGLLMYHSDEYGVYFAHHGIKGQKWGIRKYQNKDVTFTEVGKKRYGENYKNSEKAKNESQVRKKRVEAYEKTMAEMLKSAEKDGFDVKTNPKVKAYRTAGQRAVTILTIGSPAAKAT